MINRALACMVAFAACLPLQAAQAADCSGLAGKYLFDVKKPALTAALKSLLGKAYRRFDERYQTQTPFESTGDGYVFASACMPHDCTVNEAFLGIEEASCKVFVALMEDEKFTLVLPEENWPGSLEDERVGWMNRN